ncbi:MAG: acylphosphatase [Acidimicrobiales bacterium]|nr:acylphosphatase [Acidimicrobiales bacterium]
MTEIRRAMTVHGRVQGVSFRWYTAEEANRLGLVGWVRNEHDGTVRLEAQGPEEDVEALFSWVHHGPPLARVVGVDVEELEPTTVDIDFSVEH